MVRLPSIMLAIVLVMACCYDARAYVRASLGAARGRGLYSVVETPDTNGGSKVDVIEYSENKGGNRMYGKKQVVQWDQSSTMFRSSSAALSAADPNNHTKKKKTGIRAPLKFMTRVLYNNFVPSGNITDDYFTYSRWRACQRFVSATSSVFGTQALVMALGVKSGKNLGIAAATAWVMKDALGKVSRILWASNFGRKFDSDAKKWRYRASILYALGSGLEVLTYIIPSFFLVTAATANGLKQMAMLTSSATRNAIYRSFARKSDNIGDVTAKGEAQIAVVDLLGIFSGVFISRLTTSSRLRLVTTFLGFAVLDLFCIYNEIQSVVFNALNYERTQIVLRDIMNKIRPSSSTPSTDGGDGLTTALEAMGPAAVGKKEKILLPAPIRENVFSSWSGLHVTNRLLKQSLAMFKGEEDSSSSSSNKVGDINSSSNNSSSSGEDCKFVVTLHARVATFGEAASAKLGAAMGSHDLPQWVRGVQLEPEEEGCDASLLVPVILVPQVLLHVSASKEDMLRALVVVHALLHEFDRTTAPFSVRAALRSALAKGTLPKDSVGMSSTTSTTEVEKDSDNTSASSSSSLSAAQKQLLARHGLDDDGLLRRLGRGRELERSHYSLIKQSLQVADWDVDKFMFTGVRSRVEFGSG